MDKILVYHTPDADDAFMFYALFNGKIDSEYKFEERVDDIESLNQKAMKEDLDVSAVSAYAYGNILERYYALGTGGSFGEGYGPVIVSKSKSNPQAIKESSLAVPGLLTSSYLVYRLASHAKSEIVMKFDEIIDAVLKNKVDMGLLIHEGQLTYKKYGLFKILDTYKWWENVNNDLPLPLGLNVINKKFGENECKSIKTAIQESVRYAINNPNEAINFASKFARGTDQGTLKKFALQYVNETTYEMGSRGRDAIAKLLEMAREKNLLTYNGQIKII